MKLINTNKLEEAINKVGRKTLNESIADNGINNMDDEMKATSTVPLSYASAIEDHKKLLSREKELSKDINKAGEEVEKENQRDSHNKVAKSDGLKKMKLSESFFEDWEDTTSEDIRSLRKYLRQDTVNGQYFITLYNIYKQLPKSWSKFMDEYKLTPVTTSSTPGSPSWNEGKGRYVYLNDKALSAIRSKSMSEDWHDYDFEDLSDEDAQFWMDERDTYDPDLEPDLDDYSDYSEDELRRMGAFDNLNSDDDEFLDESLEEDSVAVDLDEIDPFDLVMDTIASTGEQITVVDPKTGKRTPRMYNALYDADEIGTTADDNITIVSQDEARLEPGIQFAKDYEIEYKKYHHKDTGEWILELDPWTVNVEKLYPDRYKFVGKGTLKRGKKGVDESLEESVKISVKNFEPQKGAINTYEIIKERGKLDDLESLIDEMYPNGIDEGAFNDLLWFDSEWVLEMLEIEVE